MPAFVKCESRKVDVANRIDRRARIESFPKGKGRFMDSVAALPQGVGNPFPGQERPEPTGQLPGQGFMNFSLPMELRKRSGRKVLIETPFHQEGYTNAPVSKVPGILA